MLRAVQPAAGTLEFEARVTRETEDERRVTPVTIQELRRILLEHLE
jgi:hypothetical protein